MPYHEKNNNNRGRAVARRPAAKAHSSLSSAPTRIIPLVEVAKVSTVEVGVVWFDGSDVHGEVDFGDLIDGDRERVADLFAEASCIDTDHDRAHGDLGKIVDAGAAGLSGPGGAAIHIANDDGCTRNGGAAGVYDGSGN